MDNATKLQLLEEMWDMDPGSLNPETVLEEIEEWDSMSKLSLIIMIDEQFGKVITGNDIQALKTVEDILNIMAPK